MALSTHALLVVLPQRFECSEPCCQTQLMLSCSVLSLHFQEHFQEHYQAGQEQQEE